jgi:cobalamin biosynthesis Mg chelatase CobN
VVISADPNFSGLSASKTFNINDNDTKPQETTTPTDTTTQNNPTSSNAQTANQEVNNEEDEEKPTVTEVSMSDLSGNVKQKNDEGKYAYENGNPIIIRGKTVPSGIVKLYIFSEPQEATVTADENGNWEYTIESIEPGDHRVEVEVTDPATGDTSERTEVLAFAVAQASEAENVAVVTEEVAPVEDNSSLLPIVVIAVVLLAVGAGGGYWFWRKKHANVESQASTSAETNPQPSIVNEVTDSPEPKIDDNN